VCNLNYAPTTLGVQSWREIICGGVREQKSLITTALDGIPYYWKSWAILNPIHRHFVSHFNVNCHFVHELFPEDCHGRTELSGIMLTRQENWKLARKTFYVCLRTHTKNPKWTSTMNSRYFDLFSSWLPKEKCSGSVSSRLQKCIQNSGHSVKIWL
jgi:hypothetical protein